MKGFIKGIRWSIFPLFNNFIKNFFKVLHKLLILLSYLFSLLHEFLITYIINKWIFVRFKVFALQSWNPLVIFNSSYLCWRVLNYFDILFTLTILLNIHYFLLRCQWLSYYFLFIIKLIRYFTLITACDTRRWDLHTIRFIILTFFYY